MLRLCVTLSVLLRFQVAGITGRDLVQESCDSTICHPVLKVIQRNGYEEIEIPTLHWLRTFVNGTDMETAIKLGLDKFFSYSRFHNDAGTIVPISAPWIIQAAFENGIIKRQFSVYVSLPLEIQTPPVPKDSSVQLFITSSKIYGSHFVTEQENEEYGRLANELKKKLENDHHSFYDSSIFIVRFNKAGRVKLCFIGK